MPVSLWIVPYYCIVLVATFIGFRLARRYPPNSRKYKRAALAISCTAIVLINGPIILLLLVMARYFIFGDAGH
jgi:hypothetical protein